MNKSKLLALLAVAIALTGTTVTFAATSGTTDVSVTSSSSSVASINADPADGTTFDGDELTGNEPTWSPVIGSVGSINSSEDGALYNVTTPGHSNDLRMTLYFTNPEMLSNSYSYLNLNITVYEKSGDSWVQENSSTLSLTNGFVTFNVAEDYDGTYAVAITGGSFYVDDSGTLSPSYFLDVRAG